MWPSFTVRVLQSTDWWMVSAQWASAIAIIIAAVYAGSYQIRKDKKERDAKFSYIFGRVIIAPYKLDNLLKTITEIEELDDNQLKEAIKILPIFFNAYALDKDLQFFIDNEELISSYIPRGLGIAPIGCSLNFHTVFFWSQKVLNDVQDNTERNFLNTFKQKVIDLNDDINTLLVSLKNSKYSVFRQKGFRDEWDKLDESNTTN